MPTISIVIPVYNSEKYISRCVDSILNQSFQDFEVILVDDYSSDESLRIITNFSDSRIHVISNKENLGTAMVRKMGYLTAKGEFLLFCDSDDWLPVTALEDLYRTIVETNSDIVVGNFDICSDQSTVISTFKNTFSYGLDKNSLFKALLKREFSHSLCARIFRTKLFQCADNGEINHFTNSEDGYVFYQVLRRASSIQSLNKSVYCYFVNPVSSSRRKLNYPSLDNMAFFASKLRNFIPQEPYLYKLLDEYISYAAYYYMLNGSKNLFMTIKALKKYRLLKYINPCYCSHNFHTFYEIFKIVLKSIKFNI